MLRSLYTDEIKIVYKGVRIVDDDTIIDDNSKVIIISNENANTDVTPPLTTFNEVVSLSLYHI
jgi:hypothetical protein